MPPISSDQASFIVETGKEILQTAADLTSGRDPTYIRDAQPDNVIDALALAAARQGCRRYQQKGGDYSSRRAARAERACRPYLDSLEPGKGPQIELPFRGGQCPVAYNVTFNATGASAACNPIEFGTVTVSAGTGPISIRKVHNTAQSSQSGGLCPGFTYNNVILKNAAGESVLVGQGRGIRLNSISFARVGGGLDNCGNPPPDFEPPPAPSTPLPPGPQPFTRLPDIDVDVDVTINPDFSINVDIGTGPITIDPFADPPTEEPGGDTGPSDGPPGDIGEPGTPEDTEPGGEASGCAPEGSVLVGVKVNILSVPANVREFFPGVYRGVCYAYMGTPGNLDHDPAGSMLRDGQFIFAERDNLTCYEVRANTGVILRVTPYYRSVEA